VSELIGFPFTKGTSRVWRIEPGSVGATCDPANSQTGACRSFATGFSSAIDLTFGRDGTMYVLEMAKDGLGGFLVLGKVETLLGDARGLFSPVNARERIFRKV
jgi:hypothetical protein